MLHYFIVDLSNNNDFYSIGIDGGTREESENYLQSISRSVRFLKTVDDTRKYKNFKELGFGRLFHCKYTARIPNGVDKDSREHYLSEWGVNGE